MYHDIGKMLNPVFFTENQSGVNPHDQLSYKQSAQIVINHVTDGMKLAEVVRVINDIAHEVDVVGLTVAEPMPRVAIRIREMLAQLPLLK